jgi:hypothetical protein
MHPAGSVPAALHEVTAMISQPVVYYLLSGQALLAFRLFEAKPLTARAAATEPFYPEF